MAGGDVKASCADGAPCSNPRGCVVGGCQRVVAQSPEHDAARIEQIRCRPGGADWWDVKQLQADVRKLLEIIDRNNACGNDR